MTTYHQVLDSAGPGDATTHVALQTRHGLRGLGRGDVFARSIEPDTDAGVGLLQDLPLGRPTDVVIYHSSLGSPEVTEAMLRRPEQLVLVHHGTDPPTVIPESDLSSAAILPTGQSSLALLRCRVTLAITFSEVDADELVQLGYTGVHVAANGFRPGRLAGLPIDADTELELGRTVGVPFVLSMSELLPDNCQHVLLQALHVLQSVHRVELGLVLVGSAPNAPYARALHDLTRSLRLQYVWFAGPQSDSSLATIYRHTRSFCSASRQTGGFGLHPLEAMAFGVPAIVREAGSTADTAGPGALVLPYESGPLMFAEALLMVDQDDGLRSSLIDAGFHRVDEYLTASPTQSVAEIIAGAGLAS